MLQLVEANKANLKLRHGLSIYLCTFLFINLFVYKPKTYLGLDDFHNLVKLLTRQGAHR